MGIFLTLRRHRIQSGHREFQIHGRVYEHTQCDTKIFSEIPQGRKYVVVSEIMVSRLSQLTPTRSSDVFVQKIILRLRVVLIRTFKIGNYSN